MLKILLLGKQKIENYKAIIESLSAVPIYLPYESPDLINPQDYDGLLVCGGNDVSPSYYGEEINGSVNIDEPRDKHELTIVNKFIEAKKSIMGICRGLQLLNVALGGSLIQDIDSKDIHKSTENGDRIHSVNATQGNIFYELYGGSFAVNSAHHQAIKDLGNGFIPCVRKGDLIEAIVHKSLPIIAVQWHPERLHLLNNVSDGTLLFKHFLSLCN